MAPDSKPSYEELVRRVQELEALVAADGRAESLPRKHAAPRLREEHLPQLAETIREVFWLGTPDWGTLHYISPACAHIWGLPPERLYAHPLSWLDTVLEEDREMVRSAIPARVRRKTKKLPFPDYRIRMPDGSIRWIATRIYPVPETSGAQRKIAGIAADITERKLAEEALRRCETDMHRAQRIAHFANWSWNLATGEAIWSDELFRIAGLDPTQPAPSLAEHLALFSPESRAALSRCVEKALADGEPYFLEMQLLRQNGEVRTLQNFGEVVMNPEGYLEHLFGVVLDITDRKQVEGNLERVKEELESQVLERTHELQMKNIALSEVLRQLDVEKQHLEGKINSNIHALLLPVIDRLIEKSSSVDSRYLKILKQNLRDLTSNHGVKLSGSGYRLTAKETELCALIKSGFTVKEIAIMQGLSERTVETRRYIIRKKLGISSRNASLADFLADL